LDRARAERVPTFTHFLDLPILFLIVSLGTLKPDTWTVFLVGLVIAVAAAAGLTVLVPRLYPWSAPEASDAGGRPSPEGDGGSRPASSGRRP
jgi:hypothetical protein